jgi:putative ABC transport system permease protein
MALAAGVTLQKRTGKRFSAQRTLALTSAVTIAMVINGGVIALVQVGVESFFNAWYIIPLLGMLLGNCLGSAVVGLRSYDQRIRKEEMRYKYMISCGATRKEALFPFISGAVRDAISPSIAQTAAIGLIWLPGMMTGQILGGSDPTTAIKYQIVVLTTIFSASVITIILSILFTVGSDFDEYGLLKNKNI